jgi:hypothetical protein
MSTFNDNFQRNMLLQPTIVKTVNKWHASLINLTYCIKTQRVYINVQCISFLKCVFSQQSVL